MSVQSYWQFNRINQGDCMSKHTNKPVVASSGDKQVSEIAISSATHKAQQAQRLIRTSQMKELELSGAFAVKDNQLFKQIANQAPKQNTKQEDKL